MQDYDYFPFDSAQLGQIAINAGKIVPGSPSFTIRGKDKTLKTADGRTHCFRLAAFPEAEFLMFGDHRDLTGHAKESFVLRLFQAGNLFFEFTGFISAGYREEDGLTHITLRGDCPLELEED